MNNKFLFLCSAALCAGIAVQAQENPQNRMSSEVVSVEKGYDPKVKTGSKASFTPQQAPQQHEKLPVSYRTNDRAVEFDFEAQPVSALVLEGTAASAQYPNYIKGGIGYNLSTLLEGYYTHSWGKNTLSAGINHDRAERDISFFPDNSVFGHTDASASIKHAARRYDLGAYARYFAGMLERGVALAPAQFEAMFVSTAHSEADLEATLEAVRATFASMAG